MREEPERTKGEFFDQGSMPPKQFVISADERSERITL